MLQILYAIIVKQQYHDCRDFCLHSIFTENWLPTCQTVLICVKSSNDKWLLSQYYTIIAPYDYC